MSHRARLVEGFRALSVGVFVGAITIALLQSLLGVAWRFALAAVDPLLAVVLGPITGLVTLLILLPMYVGLYAMVRDDASINEAVSATTRNYGRVFVADAVAVGFAFLAALGGATTVYVVHTAVRLVEYTGGRTAPPAVQPALYFLVAGAVLGFWIAFLATRFADVLVAFDDRSPRVAWADSLRFVRRRPGAFAGYAMVTTVLLAGPRVFAAVLADPPTLGRLVGQIGVVSVFVGVALALASAVHVSYFQGSVRPAPGDGRRGVPRRRLALAGLIIVAGIAGGVVVRTADLGVTEPTPEPLPNDLAEVPEVAIDNTVTASHRRAITMRNVSAGGEARPYQTSAVDYPDRQLRIRLYGDGEEYVGGFLGEGIIANHVSMNESTVPSSEWIVYPYSGWGITAGGEQQATLLDEADWQLHEETEETLTYRIEDPDAVDATLASGRLGSRGGFAADTHATMVVDRSVGIVERVTYHLQSRETGYAYIYVERYESVGGDPVDRPPTLGPRRTYEWLWDALYY